MAGGDDGRLLESIRAAVRAELEDVHLLLDQLLQGQKKLLEGGDHDAGGDQRPKQRASIAWKNGERPTLGNRSKSGNLNGGSLCLNTENDSKRSASKGRRSMDAEDSPRGSVQTLQRELLAVPEQHGGGRTSIMSRAGAVSTPVEMQGGRQRRESTFSQMLPNFAMGRRASNMFHGSPGNVRSVDNLEDRLAELMMNRRESAMSAHSKSTDNMGRLEEEDELEEECEEPLTPRSVGQARSPDGGSPIAILPGEPRTEAPVETMNLPRQASPGSNDDDDEEEKEDLFARGLANGTGTIRATRRVGLPEVPEDQAVAAQASMPIPTHQHQTLKSFWNEHDEVTLKRTRTEMLRTSVVAKEAVMHGHFSQYQLCVWRSSEAVLRLAGIVPCGDSLQGFAYPFLVILLCILAAGAFVHKAVESNSWFSVDQAAYCLVMGLAMFSLVMLNRIYELLGPMKTPLLDYAIHNDFHDFWLDATPKYGVLPIAFVFFEIANYSGLFHFFARDCASQDGIIRAPAHLLAARGFVDCVFASLVYTQIHVSKFLELMVDQFSVMYVSDQDPQEGVLQWNLIQAMLRQAAKRLDTSCVLLFTSALLGFGPMAAEVLVGAPPGSDTACQGHALNRLSQQVLSTLARTGLLLYALTFGAAITEKCLRTKCFINSLIDEDGDILDDDREKLVRYIGDSGAAFEVKGLKITGFHIMKGAYIMGAVLFTICLQAVRNYSTESSPAS